MRSCVIFATVPAPVETVQPIGLLTQRLKARLSLFALSRGLTTWSILIWVVALGFLIPTATALLDFIAFLRLVNICEGNAWLKVVREHSHGRVLALRDAMIGRDKIARLFFVVHLCLIAYYLPNKQL